MFILESKILEVVEVKRKSKASMISSLKVWDRIKLSVEAKAVNGNCGSYASYVLVENVDKVGCTYLSFNQINRLYDVVELREIYHV